MATKKTATAELQSDVANLSVTALKQLQSAISKQLKVHEEAEAEAEVERMKQLKAGNDGEYRRVCQELDALENEVSKKISAAKRKVEELISEFQKRPESDDYYFSVSIGEETFYSGDGYWSNSGY